MRGNSPGGLGNGDRHDDGVIGIEVVIGRGMISVEEAVQVSERQRADYIWWRVGSRLRVNTKMLLRLHEDTPPKQVYVIPPA